MRKKVAFDYYVLLFFLLSGLGWLWEVCLYLVRDGKFVNRGILFGPWLPIYGAGSLFLYFLLHRCHRWNRKILPVFLVSMTVCSVLEYGTGYLLLKMWGVRWWDYSEMFLNLDGHVCLASCLMFGVGGVLLMFVLAPVYTALYHKVPVKVRTIVSLLLLVLFIVDAAYSAEVPHVGRGITY